VPDWTLRGYSELRELGTGSFGRVVLARHDASGTLVAIKYLAVDLLGGEFFLSRFREEARTLATLRSPHITWLYEYAEAGAGAAIVMEAVSGASLRAVLDEHGPAAPEAALAVLKGSLLGLADAHAAGIVHRDYKPENVLVQENGQSKIADFGIAVRSGDADMPAGTPAYMAPEQWMGAPAAPATDVYAATCVFFEYISGQKPYGRADRDTLRNRHLRTPVPAGGVPEPVRPLVLRGMAKNPADRPLTALDFVEELEQIAREAYGSDWERSGWKRLAEVTAGLAGLSLGVALGTSLGSGGGAAGGLGTAGAGAGGAGAGGAGGAAGGGAAGGATGAGAAGGAGAGGAATGTTASGSTSAGGVGGAGGGGTTAGGHGAARTILGHAGTKVGLAVGGAAVVGAALLVVVHPGDHKASPRAPVTRAPASRPLTLAFASFSSRLTKPDMTVSGTYARVDGGSDPAVAQRANHALHQPLDQQLERYRTSRVDAVPPTKNAGIATSVEIGLRGPRLVAVRYRFRGHDDAPLTPFDQVATRAVMVDLTTGRRIRARDILQSTALTRSSLTDLERRIDRAAPNGGLCDGTTKVAPDGLSPKTVDNDDVATRVLDLMPTGSGVRFGVVPPLLGYPFACTATEVTIPYAQISDLMRPEMLALIKTSTPGPSPSPS
jgi:serine/threonine-protein kinase